VGTCMRGCNGRIRHGRSLKLATNSRATDVTIVFHFLSFVEVLQHDISFSCSIALCILGNTMMEQQSVRLNKN
jgi:hypothetical protein